MHLWQVGTTHLHLLSETGVVTLDALIHFGLLILLVSHEELQNFYLLLVLLMFLSFLEILLEHSFFWPLHLLECSLNLILYRG